VQSIVQNYTLRNHNRSWPLRTGEKDNSNYKKRQEKYGNTYDDLSFIDTNSSHLLDTAMIMIVQMQIRLQRGTISSAILWQALSGEC